MPFQVVMGSMCYMYMFCSVQKKLEDELTQLDARFEARKRKFVEDSEKFRRELKRVSNKYNVHAVYICMLQGAL